MTPSYIGNNGQGSYSGNNISVTSYTNSHSYSGKSSVVVNTSVFSENNEPTYLASSTSSVNTLAYPVNASVSGMNQQAYPVNNGLGVNTLGYSSNNAGNKLNTGNYCENKVSELNSLPYPGNSTVGMNTPVYSGSSASGSSSVFSGNSLNSGDFSSNSGASTSTMKFSGSTASIQTCNSFSNNAIGQQYELMQNYTENSGPGINNTSCADPTWSDDCITLNSMSSGCSLDFSFMFSCQICGIMYPFASKIIKHWRVHTGVDSLICTACYVSFTDVLFLQAHWKAIHMGGLCQDPGVLMRGEEKVIGEMVCEACGAMFSQFSFLEQHVMSTHINRNNMTWKSTMYAVNNTQHNHVINNKTVHNIALTNEHSMTKHSTILDNNLIGTTSQDHSVMDHENVLDESMMTSKEDRMTDSGGDLLEPKIKIEELDSSLEEKGSNSCDGSYSSESEKALRCRVCDTASSSMEELLEHWRMHIGANTSTCSMCKKTFSDLPFLQAHWRRSHKNAFQISSLVTRNSLLPDDSTSMLCDACGYAFPDFSELEQHMMSSHVFSGPPQVPLRSRNSADNIQKFSLTPLQNISTSKTSNNITNHCKKKETSGYTVRKGSSDKSDKWNDDESIAKREAVRRKVNSSALVKNSVSYDGCLVCGEIPSDMIKHLLTHTGLSSLECCLCGKDFVDVPFLQAHWRATHMNEEVRYTNHGIYVGHYMENFSYTGKFLCEICGCYVPQFSALEKHIVLTHTIIEAPYICKCGHRFSLVDELKRHISTCSW